MMLGVSIEGVDTLLSGARLARLEDAARRRLRSRPELLDRMRARKVESDAGFGETLPGEVAEPRISRGR